MDPTGARDPLRGTHGPLFDVAGTPCEAATALGYPWKEALHYVAATMRYVLELLEEHGQYGAR